MADARPGCRVRVRFAGRLVDGACSSAPPAPSTRGRCATGRVVWPEPVLSPEVAALATRSPPATRHPGPSSRLAVPPRLAKVETGPAPARSPPPACPTRHLGALPAGPAFLDRARAGRAPRAVWSALPARTGPTRSRPPYATARRRARRRGRGAGRARPRPGGAGARRPRRGGAPRRPRPGPSATGRSCAPAEARCGSSSAPARQCSRRWPTSAWSWCGTTATTCTPSPARRTRTSATSSCSAPTWPGRRRSSAATPVPPRRRCCWTPAGHGRSTRRGRWSAPSRPGSTGRATTTWPATRSPGPPGCPR